MKLFDKVDTNKINRQNVMNTKFLHKIGNRFGKVEKCGSLEAEAAAADRVLRSTDLPDEGFPFSLSFTTGDSHAFLGSKKCNPFATKNTILYLHNR